MGFSTIAARQLDWYVGREGYLLIDLRPEKEYRKSHICGAYLLPYGQLQKKMAALPKGKVLVCYCERGGSSLAAARELARAGYEAISVAGGIEAYRGEYLDRCPKRLEEGLAQRKKQRRR